MSVFVALYRLLIRFYPRPFQEEFGDEMTAVFVKKLEQANGWQRIKICLHELLDLPLMVLLQHLYERKRRKMSPTESTVTFNNKNRPALMLTPFLLGIVYIMFTGFFIRRYPASIIIEWLSGITIFALLGLLLLITIIGIRRGLPLWSIPSIGFFIGIVGLFVFTSWINVLPGLHANGLPGRIFLLIISRFILFGHVLILALVLLVISALIPAFRPIYFQWRGDWSRLTFLIYCGIPPFLPATFDAYVGSAFYTVIGLFILLAGAWLYLRFQSSPWRVPILLLMVLLTMSIAGLAIYSLYPQQTWSTTTTSPRWWEGFVPFVDGFVWSIIILLPLFLKLLPTESLSGRSLVQNT